VDGLLFGRCLVHMTLTVSLAKESDVAVVRPSDISLTSRARPSSQNGTLRVVTKAARPDFRVKNIQPSLPEDHTRRIVGGYRHKMPGVWGP
jgi:hypothetical protein